LSAGEGLISLRPATMTDRDMVFRWRNDPFVVAQGSFHRGVEWEEHHAWFENTILGNSRRMFIVLEQGNPIGQIRFDRKDHRECVVSVYLLKAFTGRGWGVQAIRMGCATIFEVWDVDKVIACVRPDNEAGRSAFLKSRFQETEAADVCPVGHYSLTLSRNAAGVKSGLTSEE
jgi:UDP-2,4-diacetamido-2,4,6-trideoxy-beta-L-altropyranose hydrolase